VGMISLEDRLAQVQISLLQHQPFFGRLSCGLQWLLVDDLQPFKSACTNGKVIKWDRDFVNENSNEELLTIAVHELHHVFKKHMLRRGDRDPMKWNIACDYHINAEINRYCSFANLPKDTLLDMKYLNKLEESIYDELPDLPENAEQLVLAGVEDAPTGAGEERPADANRRIDRMIEAAVKYATDVGKMPGHLTDFINENRKPKIDWKTQLRRYIEPIFPKEETWEKPNKRLISRGLYVPSIKKDGIGTISILIDTSGSVSNEELSAFIAEINSILSTVSPDEVEVIWFESYVWHHERLMTGDIIHIPDQIQRGGTSFSAAFEKIDAMPRCVICLTDGRDSYSFDPPPCQTIWVITSEVNPKWGNKIHLEL
jgi:predicted metal-dependent peptidase